MKLLPVVTRSSVFLIAIPFVYAFIQHNPVHCTYGTTQCRTAFVRPYSNNEDMLVNVTEWQSLNDTDESNNDVQSQRPHRPSPGLVTQAGGTLQSQFGSKVPNLTPMERIALTANGNLQIIFSSYYDSPVHVDVDSCVRRAGTVEAIWDRTAHLSVLNQNFCTAKSTITVHSNECIQLIQSGEVGIGQLFRYLDKLPTFDLKDAGRCEDGGMWRRYEIGCDELTCDIYEHFHPRAWELNM